MLVEDAILVSSETADVALIAQPEWRKNRSQGRDLHPADPAQLDVRDRAHPDAGVAGQVELSPTTTLSQRPDQSPESRIVHGSQDARRLLSATYPPRLSTFVAGASDKLAPKRLLWSVATVALVDDLDLKLSRARDWCDSASLDLELGQDQAISECERP